tara:strand:+ start:5482 stop:6936 length:1455 start_codon:yes stop_codon:yes gene_type:complete
MNDVSLENLRKEYDPEQIAQMVSTMYKNDDGSPVILSPTQIDIFATISMKLRPRVHCSTFTRFGKSRTTALAVLTRAATFPEKWAIVAPNAKKAKIVMNYINRHIFDNEFTAGRFRMDKGDSAESIRRSRNKSHITFDVGNDLMGEVFIVSAGDAIGEGAANIVEDEASLIDNNDHSMVMRMLGDNPEENFLFKIGNPFLRNHFLTSSMDPAYLQIIVDCYQGLNEGRITEQTIEENRGYSFFKVLYECKFPSAESVDEQGWSYLFTDELIKKAQERDLELRGIKRLGVDVARGGRNYNAWVIRGDNYARVVKKDLDNDLMSVAGKTKDIMLEEGVAPNEVYIDDVGVGGGVVDRLKEMGYQINPIKEGAKAQNSEEYENLKAELYAGEDGLEAWVRQGGFLVPHADWIELNKIRFKKKSNGKTWIEPKADMRKRGEESPDVADALMLTFASDAVSGKNFFVPNQAPNPTDVLKGNNSGGLWDM